MTTKTTKTRKVSEVRSKKNEQSKKKNLVCAQGEQCFWAVDGNVIANLVELRDALNRMSDEVFAYHVNKERNDFANWIENVLQDSELGKSFRAAKRPHTARLVIVRRLREYNV